MIALLIATLVAVEPEAEWMEPRAEEKAAVEPEPAAVTAAPVPPAPAAATKARVQFSVSLSAGSQIFTQRAYDAVDSDDNLPMFSVGLGASFALPRGWLDTELAFHGGSTSEYVHRQSVELVVRCAGVSVA